MTKIQEVFVSYPVSAAGKDMVIKNFVTNAHKFMEIATSHTAIIKISPEKINTEKIKFIRNTMMLADIELEKAQQLHERFEEEGEEPPPIPIEEEDIIEEKEEEDIAIDIFGADGI